MRTSLGKSTLAGQVSLGSLFIFSGINVTPLAGGYHIGEGPDDRTMSTLENHGITDYVHHARKVRPDGIAVCGEI
jgi:hypothetical protein